MCCINSSLKHCFIVSPPTDHSGCVMKYVSQGSLRVIMFCHIGLCLDKPGNGVDSKQQDDILPRLLQLVSETRSKPALSIKVIVCWKPNLLSVVISPTSPYIPSIGIATRVQHRSSSTSVSSDSTIHEQDTPRVDRCEIGLKTGKELLHGCPPQSV